MKKVKQLLSLALVLCLCLGLLPVTGAAKKESDYDYTTGVHQFISDKEESTAQSDFYATTMTVTADLDAGTATVNFKRSIRQSESEYKYSAERYKAVQDLIGNNMSCTYTGKVEAKELRGSLHIYISDLRWTGEATYYIWDVVCQNGQYIPRMVDDSRTDVPIVLDLSPGGGWWSARVCIATALYQAGQSDEWWDSNETGAMRLTHSLAEKTGPEPALEPAPEPTPTPAPPPTAPRLTFKYNTDDGTVTDNGDGTATVKPAQGKKVKDIQNGGKPIPETNWVYEGEIVIIDYIPEPTKPVEVIFEGEPEGGFLLPERPAVADIGQFRDIATGDWFRGVTAKVVRRGIFNGKSTDTFAPYDNITLAEAIKLAAVTYTVLYDQDHVFPMGSPWYQPYAEYLSALTGIDYFMYDDPGRVINRSEFAEIMWVCLKGFTSAERNKNVVDAGAIPDLPNADAYDRVYDLYRAGILTGSDEKGTFHPASNIMRCEVAAIVCRFVDPTERRSITLRKGSGGETIPAQAHRGDSNLSSVTIPGSVSTVGSMAYAECANLTQVVMEPGVTVIENGAFSFCPNLKSVTIPSTVTSIAPNAFLSLPDNGVVLHVAPGSYALEFAQQYDIRYVTDQ